MLVFWLVALFWPSLEQEPRSLEQLQPTWSLASWGPVELHTLALAFEYT